MSKVVSDELLRRAICVIELYIEEDMLADGYGGGSESPLLEDAQDVLKELKALDGVDDNKERDR
jgi:hypothetical protein